MAKLDIDDIKTFGGSVDFGKTAEDYSQHRRGFPDRFFEELSKRAYAKSEQVALDIGTGTGTVALGLAKLGLSVTGMDPAEPLLVEARRFAKAQSLDAQFMVGSAESLPFENQSLDLVTAGQCWHWFDRPKAAAETKRVLKPGGRIIIAHFDWLPLTGSVVEATEALILKVNPGWALAGGDGLYPDWLSDLTNTNFAEIETFSFDQDVFYSHEAWRGRIRASAGIKAHLNEAKTTEFDQRLKAHLETYFPKDPLVVPAPCLGRDRNQRSPDCVIQAHDFVGSRDSWIILRRTGS